MEVVGAVASVAQLAATAFTLSKTLYEVGDAFANASGDIQDLARDLSLFSESLLQLQRLLEFNKTTYSINIYVLTEKIIRDCTELHTRIEKLVKKLDKRSVKAKLQWLYKERRIKDLLARLRDMKMTLLSILSTLNLDVQLSQMNVSAGSTLNRREEDKVDEQAVDMIQFLAWQKAQEESAKANTPPSNLRRDQILSRGVFTANCSVNMIENTFDPAQSDSRSISSLDSMQTFHTAASTQQSLPGTDLPGKEKAWRTELAVMVRKHFDMSAADAMAWVQAQTLPPKLPKSPTVDQLSSPVNASLTATWQGSPLHFDIDTCPSYQNFPSDPLYGNYDCASITSISSEDPMDAYFGRERVQHEPREPITQQQCDIVEVQEQAISRSHAAAQPRTLKGRKVMARNWKGSARRRARGRNVRVENTGDKQDAQEEPLKSPEFAISTADYSINRARSSPYIPEFAAEADLGEDNPFIWCSNASNSTICATQTGPPICLPICALPLDQTNQVELSSENNSYFTSSPMQMATSMDYYSHDDERNDSSYARSIQGIEYETSSSLYADRPSCHFYLDVNTPPNWSSASQIAVDKHKLESTSSTLPSGDEGRADAALEPPKILDRAVLFAPAIMPSIRDNDAPSSFIPQKTVLWCHAYNRLSVSNEPISEVLKKLGAGATDFEFTPEYGIYKALQLAVKSKGALNAHSSFQVWREKFVKIFDVLSMVTDKLAIEKARLGLYFLCRVLETLAKVPLVCWDSVSLILDQLTDLTGLMIRYTILESIFCNWKGMALRNDFEEALIELCMDELRYMCQMYCQLKGGVCETEQLAMLSPYMNKVLESDKSCRNFTLIVDMDAATNASGDAFFKSAEDTPESDDSDQVASGISYDLPAQSIITQ